MDICGEILNQENYGGIPFPQKYATDIKSNKNILPNLHNQGSLNGTKIVKLHMIQEENGYQRASWDSVQSITHNHTPVESLRVLSLSC